MRKHAASRQCASAAAAAQNEKLALKENPEAGVDSASIWRRRKPLQASWLTKKKLVEEAAKRKPARRKRGGIIS